MSDLNRMSILDTTRGCGLAGELGKHYGAGIAAAMSSCFHALVEGDEKKYQKLFRSLTREQQEEVYEYRVPEPITWDTGEGYSEELTVENADREPEVALEFEAGRCVGHLDLRWPVKRHKRPWVVVVDMKRGHWTSSPDSLQLAAYGMASAMELDAEGWTPAIWDLTNGEYIWGAPVELDGLEAMELWDVLEHAASNLADVGTTGGHCDGCYSRLHCAEYLMPPSDALEELAPFTEPGMEMDGEKAAVLLLTAQRAEKTAKAVIGNLKAWADRNGGIKDGNGKVWSAGMRKGRRGLPSLKVLQEKEPEFVARHMTTGPSYSEYRWKNDRRTR